MSGSVGSVGRSHRKGISLIELAERFPNEQAAVEWFESLRWPDGELCCLRCGSVDAYRVKSRKPMPYRCRDCKRYFSLKTGSAMEASNLPLKKWAWAIYLSATSLKGVSAMKLHRDLKISYQAAWFMYHRIREGFAAEAAELDRFAGPVEVDEGYFGGKRENKPLAIRRTLSGRGPVDMAKVVAVKDRETKRIKAVVVDSVDKATVHPLIESSREAGAKVYTDEARVYDGLDNREAVKHSVGEYVDGLAHVNGVESFWSMLKRGYHGTFHHVSWKHLQRYVYEFAGRHNIRDMDTIDQMEQIAAGMVGRRLLFRELTWNPEEVEV